MAEDVSFAKSKSYAFPSRLRGSLTASSHSGHHGSSIGKNARIIPSAKGTQKTELMSVMQKKKERKHMQCNTLVPTYICAQRTKKGKNSLEEEDAWITKKNAALRIMLCPQHLFKSRVGMGVYLH